MNFAVYSDVLVVFLVCLPGALGVSIPLIAEKLVHRRTGRPSSGLRYACIFAPLVTVGLYTLLGFLAGGGRPPHDRLMIAIGIAAGLVSAGAGLAAGLVGRSLVRR